MCPTPGQRAGLQLLESGAIVAILILILEWITPWASGRKTDPAELAFALIFGTTCVVMHVTLAYLRPPNKAELVAQVEEILHEEERLRTSPEMPRVRQMAHWMTNDPRMANDPTWPETLPLPAVRPPVPKRL